jgi:hypothetical protein
MAFPNFKFRFMAFRISSSEMTKYKYSEIYSEIYDALLCDDAHAGTVYTGLKLKVYSQLWTKLPCIRLLYIYRSVETLSRGYNSTGF